jgi:diguanylate cyclase (GGDEF)-like protein/PAS domain S-box-containing protein
MPYNLPIEYVIRTGILECPPHTPILEAARLMSEANCSSILISDKGNIIGIWTERDALAADFSDPSIFSQPVSGVMSSPVMTLHYKTTIGEAAQHFTKKGVRHFLVIDDGGKHLGIITQTDIIRNSGIELSIRLRTLKSLVRHTPLIVPSGILLSAAIKKMNDARHDAVVVDFSDELGILTERDVIRAIGGGRADVSVAGIAGRPLFCMEENASLHHALNIFVEKGIRHLGMTGDGGKLAGVVSYADILASIEHDYVEELRQALKDYEYKLDVADHHLLVAKKVFEAADEAITITDTDAVIQSVNPTFTRITGFEPAEAIGKKSSILKSGHHGPEFYQKMWGALKTDGRWQGEIWDKRKNGEIYLKWLTINAVRNAVGEITNYTATFSDVTERKRAEVEQDDLRCNLQALLNAIQESAFLMERQGKMLIVNEVGAQRLNTTPEELAGKNVFEILPPDVAQSRRARFEQIARSGMPETFEDERAGRRFLSTTYPIRDASGEIARFAVYAADVTQQRRLEAIEEMFPAINQKVLQGLPLHEVLTFICEKVVELFHLEVAWVGRKEPDSSVSILADAGVAPDYVNRLKKIGVRWDDTPQGGGPTGSAIRLGQPHVSRVTDPRFQAWAEIALANNVQSILGIPLPIRGEIYGAFSLCSGDPAFFDSPSTVNMLTGIATRISVALEAAMDQQQVRLLGSALEAAGNAVMVTDRSGVIQWINPAFVRLSGFTQQDAAGQTPRLLKSGKMSLEHYKALWKTILKGGRWSGEVIERRKDGSLYTVSQTITPITDDKGEITHFVAIHDDITAQKLDQERIQHMAHYDALTGLPNRTLFYDRLGQSVIKAKRSHGGLALLFLDLDGFKKVNDTLGHHIGDLLLMSVADRLHQCVRESDTVARLGGDEFTVILNEAHERDKVAKVAEKIIETMARPFELEEQEAHIGVSIGIARYSEGVCSEDEMMIDADQAMYAAKSAGKNTYRFSDAARG